MSPGKSKECYYMKEGGHRSWGTSRGAGHLCRAQHLPYIRRVCTWDSFCPACGRRWFRPWSQHRASWCFAGTWGWEEKGAGAGWEGSRGTSLDRPGQLVITPQGSACATPNLKTSTPGAQQWGSGGQGVLRSQARSGRQERIQCPGVRVGDTRQGP